jgi:uncharacterized protein (TIGR03083 family)
MASFDNEALGRALCEVWASTSGVLHAAGDVWDLPTGCPGWTVRDQASHMIWALRMWQDDPEPPIDVPDLPHLRGDMGRYMEQSVEARRALDGSAVLAELDERRAVVCPRFAAFGDDDWKATFVGPMGTEMPRADMLGTQVFDQWAHEQDIRRAIGEPPTLESDAARHSLSRMAIGLSRVLPDRVPAAVGTHVVFELLGDGPAAVTLDLADKRGELVDDLPGPTDLRIVLPADLFVALACGRDVPADDVLINGDAALGQALLGALALTP